ncbi:MAG: Holliday junction resolvase RuvX [Pirellulaceae bacterium]
MTESEPNVETELPRSGRLVGIDFGTVRIGLSICDLTQRWVTPYETYTRRSEESDADYLLDLAEKERIVGWVVGLPIHCDGQESQKSKEARAFAKWLGDLSQLPIVMHDERFSTNEARQLLRDTGLSSSKKKRNLDRLAAHLILTNYLEATQRNEPIQRLDDI